MMLRSLGSIAVILVGIAITYILQRNTAHLSHSPQVQGRNNTVLFIINELPGLHNVHMATIQALHEQHPGIEVHVASFASVERRLQRVSSTAHFHALKSQGYVEAIFAAVGVGALLDFAMKPGLAGVPKLAGAVQLWISPWSNEEHFRIYEESSALFDDVDPAVVVLDTFMWPAISAVRDKSRLHAFITPNMPADTFVYEQPYLKGFWYYPVIGSPDAFPVPWTKVLANIWMAIQVHYVMSWTPAQNAKKAYLRSRGVRDVGMDFYHIHRPDTPWITQTLPAASVPVDYVPPNVTCVGPLNVRVAPAAEQSPELAAWLAQHPTILINLGNTVTYDLQRALAFSTALSSLLDKYADLQVLWKYQKSGEYDEEEFKSVAKEHIKSGRFKLTNWLDVDPVAILETGHVAAIVHHGGSGSYHDALAAGVPHIVFPVWMDTYNIGTLVEHLDIGVFGCKETSPDWTAECLESSIASVVDGSEKSKAFRRNAQRLGEIARAAPRKEGAARIVAQWAGKGYA